MATTSIHKRAQARTHYTAESYQTAYQQLRACDPFDPIVPDAEPNQAQLECLVIGALAWRIGQYRADDFDGAPYGIYSCSPAPHSITLNLAASVVALLVDAVLPRIVIRSRVDGAAVPDLAGIPGLRYRIESHHRVTLYRLGSPARITLRSAAGWSRHVEALAAATSDNARYWESAEAHPEELRARLVPGLVETREWSIALRRIGLWQHVPKEDSVFPWFPSSSQLRGPSPELLQRQGHTRAPRSSIGITVACLGRSVSARRTAVLRNVGAQWAQDGHRVLIIDMASWGNREQSDDAPAFNQAVSDGDWSRISPLMHELHRNSRSGGSLHEMVGDDLGPEPTALRSLLRLAARHADIVLVAAWPEAASSVAAVVPAVFTVVYLPTTVFGTMERIYSDRAAAILHEQEQRRELVAWLGDRFSRHLQRLQEDQEDLGERHEDQDGGHPDRVAWIHRQRDAFLAQFTERGRTRFPGAWEAGRAEWIDVVDDVYLYDSLPQAVPGHRGDGGDALQADDVTDIYHENPDDQVVAAINALVAEDGISVDKVASIYLGAVATIADVTARGVERLPGLGDRCVPPLLGVGLVEDGSEGTDEALPVLLTPQSTSALAIRDVARTVYELAHTAGSPLPDK